MSNKQLMTAQRDRIQKKAYPIIGSSPETVLEAIDKLLGGNYKIDLVQNRLTELKHPVLC